MPKGLGAMMVEVEMSLRKKAADERPACPLCGHVMDDGGVAFFCYCCTADHREWLRSRRDAAYGAQRAGQAVFWTDLELAPEVRQRNWDPSLQGAILAAARGPDGILVYFATVRGGGGRTNFRVDKRDDGWFPGPADWHWAEWTGLSLPPARSMTFCPSCSGAGMGCPHCEDGLVEEVLP